MVMAKSGTGKSYASHHYCDKSDIEKVLKNVSIALAFEWIKAGLWKVSDLKQWLEANGGKS